MDYFKGKSWKTITREERLFCAYLYFDIKKDIGRFINWLSTHLEIELSRGNNWEVGYEVCFYRDFIEEFGKEFGLSKKDFPRKRTFDLCLFGEDEIIIIEAKAFTGFELEQLKDFKEDRDYLKTLFESIGFKNIRVKILALASSGYLKRARKFRKINQGEKYFDGVIDWKSIYDLYGNDLYLRANGDD